MGHDQVIGGDPDRVIRTERVEYAVVVLSRRRFGVNGRCGCRRATTRTPLYRGKDAGPAVEPGMRTEPTRAGQSCVWTTTHQPQVT